MACSASFDGSGTCSYLTCHPRAGPISLHITSSPLPLQSPQCFPFTAGAPTSQPQLRFSDPCLPLWWDLLHLLPSPPNPGALPREPSTPTHATFLCGCSLRCLLCPGPCKWPYQVRGPKPSILSVSTPRRPALISTESLPPTATPLPWDLNCVLTCSVFPVCLRECQPFWVALANSPRCAAPSRDGGGVERPIKACAPPSPLTRASQPCTTESRWPQKAPRPGCPSVP